MKGLILSLTLVLASITAPVLAHHVPVPEVPPPAVIEQMAPKQYLMLLLEQADARHVNDTAAYPQYLSAMAEYADTGNVNALNIAAVQLGSIGQPIPALTRQPTVPAVSTTTIQVSVIALLGTLLAAMLYSLRPRNRRSEAEPVPFEAAA